MIAESGMRLLVVDDSSDAAMTMACMLSRFGHEAQIATSYDDTLQKAPLFQPEQRVFAFFVYSKRHSIRDIIVKHGGFKV